MDRHRQPDACGIEEGPGDILEGHGDIRGVRGVSLGASRSQPWVFFGLAGIGRKDGQCAEQRGPVDRHKLFEKMRFGLIVSLCVRRVRPTRRGTVSTFRFPDLAAPK